MVDIAPLLVDGPIPIEKYGPVGKCHSIDDHAFEIGILLLIFLRVVKGFPRRVDPGMNKTQEGWGRQMGNSTLILMVTKLKATLWIISQVGEKSHPITHVEIGLLPPINPLYNLLGVVGVAEYDDVDPLSKFMHSEGPENGDMAR
jgi:hypothetical protein